MQQYKHIRLYSDTEFNSAGGELISAALVSVCGERWYEACLTDAPVHFWPKAFVIPHLGVEQKIKQEMAKSFQKFMSRFDQVTIVVDQKADAKHFADLICHMNKPDQLINFEFAKPTAVVKHHSKTPHNALSDAICFMELLLGSKEVDERGVSPWSVYSELDKRGIPLNLGNSKFEVVDQTANGDFVVEVFPISDGGERAKRWKFTDYFHQVGVYRLTVTPQGN